jgi:hypothetical protein
MARRVQRGPTKGRGSGSFGGAVDSFHTTLKHYEEISHLVFLHAA